MVVLLAGCVPSGIHLPDSFSSIHDVYPTTDAVRGATNVPAGAFRKTRYEAPYEDVFRMVEVTAAQSMMTIEKMDEDAGLILAIKITPEPQPYEQNQVCMGQKNEVRYFYGISVTETGPSSTEVMLVSRAQGRCCYAGGTTVGGTVGSAMGVPFQEWEDMCKAFSSVHYADKPQDILQFFNFLRLNLLNAGLI